MSKYTTEVRFICEMKSGFPVEDIGDKSVDEILNASHFNVFNFQYPIYDENHRGELECKILKHYYTREICAETVGLWQLWLNERMNLIMPKYNKLYKAEHDILNKEFKNIDVHTDDFRTDDLLREDDYTRTDNLSLVNTHNDHDSRKYSDTPQGSITFNEANQEHYWLTDYTQTDNTGGYTNANTGTQRNAGSSANTGTVDRDIDEAGYRGGKAYYEMLEEYNKKIVNIDLMIIDELKDLFFKLW